MFGSIIGGIGKVIGGVGKAIGLDGLIGGATSAASAAASYDADRRLQKKSFDFNAAEAQKQRDYASAEREIAHEYGTAERVAAQSFSAQQAKRQMDFQERLASTQVQRAAKDMEAAGLNRILALGQPAAAPPGAMATSAGAQSKMGAGSSASGPGASGAGAAAVRNAVSLASALEQIKLTKAQTQKTMSEARAADASADRSEGVNIPFTMLLDYLGRGGEAAKAVRSMLDRLQSATGGSILDRGKSSWNYLKDKADDIRTIYINRGRDSATHPNRKR